VFQNPGPTFIHANTGIQGAPGSCLAVHGFSGVPGLVRWAGGGSGDPVSQFIDHFWPKRRSPLSVKAASSVRQWNMRFRPQTYLHVITGLANQSGIPHEIGLGIRSAQHQTALDGEFRLRHRRLHDLREPLDHGACPRLNGSPVSTPFGRSKTERCKRFWVSPEQ